MRSLADIAERSSPIVEMLNERSGLWDVTQERVSLISKYRNQVSPSNAEVADLMLEIAKSEVLWVCKGEYYALLKEIQSLTGSASKAEIVETMNMVITASKTDRIDHREWVKKTISLLRKLSAES
jgi:hypothetical protein